MSSILLIPYGVLLYIYFEHILSRCRFEGKIIQPIIYSKVHCKSVQQKLIIKRIPDSAVKFKISQKTKSSNCSYWFLIYFLYIINFLFYFPLLYWHHYNSFGFWVISWYLNVNFLACLLIKNETKIVYNTFKLNLKGFK